jgi:hypothetical protein
MRMEDIRLLSTQRSNQLRHASGAVKTQGHRIYQPERNAQFSASVGEFIRDRSGGREQGDVPFRAVEPLHEHEERLFGAAEGTAVSEETDCARHHG